MGTVAPVGAFAFAWLTFVGYHIDDAAIGYAYARNLATGLGLRPFSAAPRIEGFSNPAWILLLAITALLRVPLPLASKILQFMLSVGCFLLVRSIVLRESRRPLAANAATGLVAMNASFILWSAAGLENALLAFGLLSFVFFSMDPDRYWLGGAAAGLIAVTRPEGIAISIAILAAQWLVWPRLERGRAIKSFLICVAIFAAYEIFRLSYFHDFVANTYYAKVSGPVSVRIQAGTAYVLGFFKHGYPAILIAAGALGALLTVEARRVGGVAIAAVAAGIAFSIYAGGDWMRHWRFLSHFVPLIAVVTFVGLATLHRFLSLRYPRSGLVLPLLAATVLIVSSSGQAVSIGTLGEERFCSVAEVTHTAQVCSTLAAQLCDDRPLRVATPDIGGLLYSFPSVQVIDLAGLIDRDAARHSNDRTYWPKRLRHSPQPQVISIHHPWDGLIGLSEKTLVADGYRRIHSSEPDLNTGTNLYLRGNCRMPAGSKETFRLSKAE